MKECRWLSRRMNWRGRLLFAFFFILRTEKSTFAFNIFTIDYVNNWAAIFLLWWNNFFCYSHWHKVCLFSAWRIRANFRVNFIHFSSVTADFYGRLRQSGERHIWFYGFESGYYGCGCTMWMCCTYDDNKANTDEIMMWRRIGAGATCMLIFSYIHLMHSQSTYMLPYTNDFLIFFLFWRCWTMSPWFGGNGSRSPIVHIPSRTYFCMSTSTQRLRASRACVLSVWT